MQSICLPTKLHVHTKHHALEADTILSFRNPKEHEQGKEQVDDVEIQSNGGPRVFVVGVPLDQVVGVVDDVTAEDKRCHPPKDHQRQPNPRKKKPDFQARRQRRSLQSIARKETMALQIELPE
ncbi:hypothetical protein HPP92_026608 [Vanilla planifolia]|uniref:Uncharacterized protein n=1 Tax=Vanilla planifolia TaxID=51239 RepID=A0A835PCA2_VANPL|nr:hypothetical protein HPP92_026608 [Vanilla planifolia]